MIFSELSSLSQLYLVLHLLVGDLSIIKCQHGRLVYPVKIPVGSCIEMTTIFAKNWVLLEFIKLEIVLVSFLN